MKLVSFKYDQKNAAGVLSACEKKVYTFQQLGFDYCDMNAFIDAYAEDEHLLSSVTASIAKLEENANAGVALSHVQLLSPIPHPRQDVICLGINYSDHAEESARFAKKDFGGERNEAIYFAKRVNEAVAHQGTIKASDTVITSLDYEVEFTAIIGRDAKNVSVEEAYAYILGYTILNDVTDRTIQTRHKQWYFGKSLDGFTPIGPCIVTEDCFQRPPVVNIKSYVNDELRQNSSTDLLIFDLAHIISELSSGMTLRRGTIIATGTPSGVGMGFDPPRFLQKGDVVKCYIEGIGELENTIC